MEESDIIEEREDFMISPSGGLPTLRKAYFLNPSVTSIEGPSLKLPRLTPKPVWPLKVGFHGWRDPSRKWETWLKKMHSRYLSVWKNAGIYEAIMCSTYKITKDDDLIFGFAERWVSDTNTFVFPWGEATVTLEDMLVLGGFSVLGCPVSLPLEPDGDEVKVEEFLEKMRESLAKLGKDSHCQWLNVFMDSGDEFEHEAFLSLWLSRFVFPGGDHVDGIGSHVFAIAIHLARGRRLALGPAVLASIYRDLGLLSETMAASSKLNEDGASWHLTLWSPLQFVQVWAWERFPTLQPESNFVERGMVRVSRWEGAKDPEIGNVRPAIQSAGASFLWRPYAIPVDDWSCTTMFYKKDEEFVKSENLSSESESFVRCLRACQLVGIDCQEPYNPHRVALQFGFDQDYPGWIDRGTTCVEIALWNYSKPLNDDEVLYVPSRLSKAGMTTRYLEWWRDVVLCLVNPMKGLVKGRRSSRKRLECPLNWQKVVFINGKGKKRLIKCKTANGPVVPLGFEPLHDDGAQGMVLEQSIESNCGKESKGNFADFNMESVLALEARILSLESEIARVKSLAKRVQD